MAGWRVTIRTDVQDNIRQHSTPALEYRTQG